MDSLLPWDFGHPWLEGALGKGLFGGWGSEGCGDTDEPLEQVFGQH
jgi:hypothetical protein